MKISIVGLFLTFVLVVSAANWSPEDYEIFSLNDKIKQDLGKDVTFYLWLDLTNGPKATLKEITKAYRKKSRELHPDKVGGKSKSLRKKAEERFQRLSLVGNILRDQSLKRRYDYFYSKGFPEWKGTGYFYTKFRPGFILTILVLYVLVGGLHFLALRISRKQDFNRIAELKRLIKDQAWQGSSIPPVDGSDRKVKNEMNGKIFVVKPNGNVYLVVDEAKDELVELDESSINLSPFFKETVAFKLPAFLWNVSFGKLFSKPISTEVEYSRGTTTDSIEKSVDQKKKKAKKAPKGEKIELPNGKVIYGRASNARNRKQK